MAKQGFTNEDIAEELRIRRTGSVMNLLRIALGVDRKRTMDELALIEDFDRQINDLRCWPPDGINDSISTAYNNPFESTKNVVSWQAADGRFRAWQDGELIYDSGPLDHQGGTND